MDSFLDETVNYLYEKYDHRISDLCIVFPNRRAGLFFKKYLSQKIKTPLWLPEIFSIEDFIVKLSDLQILDTVDLIFELYEVYLEKTPDEPDSFDVFTKWASVLLNDFNEIDRYLLNAKKLFSNLSDVKEIESWSLNSEELTEFQKKYLAFWDLLGIYYQQFSIRLLSKKLAYQGLAYRWVAENISNKIHDQPWHKIIFVGFNALSKAEEKIMQTILEQQKGELLWDADSYCTQDKKQEAGKFLRSHKKQHSTTHPDSPFLWENDFLSNDKKKIQLIGAAKNIAQAKIAGNILTTLPTETQQTAVVLGDENLLFPVLSYLPSSIETINVTMGYPLKSSSLNDFFNSFFDLQLRSKTTSGSAQFYFTDVVKIFQHPYIHYFFKYTPAGYLPSKIITEVLTKNVVFITFSTLSKSIISFPDEELKFVKAILEKWTNPKDALLFLTSLMLKLKAEIDAKREDRFFQKKINLDAEFLATYSYLLSRTGDLVGKYNSVTDIKTLQSILNQLVSSATLPFFGEPLNGLQIMGVLETRVLDFENIIVLSANENILPEAKSQNSFIPFEIKKLFGLPTYSDRDAIFAYHFYRLMQRAKNIFIVYNTESDAFGKGEKSRFIAQLVYELPKINPNITIEEKIVDIKINSSVFDNPIVITKTKEIVEKIDFKAAKGFSPSLLNTYRNCSLQFYFRYVAGLQEDDKVTEIIGADTLGNVIHKVLEVLYTPYIGKSLRQFDINAMKHLVETETEKAFKNYYNQSDLSYGKNLLSVKVAIKFVQDFLNSELDTISIIALENELETSLLIPSINKSILLKGKMDRIDKVNGTTRIIDYKTGSVENNELKIKDWDDFLTNTKLNKSFQLLMYAYIYNKYEKNNSSNLQSGIISFRKLSEGIKTVAVNDESILNTPILEAFEKQLTQLIETIYNTNQSFVQTPNAEICEYCSYKMICNK